MVTRRAAAILLVVLAFGAAAFYAGYRTGKAGKDRALRELAQEPEPGAERPAEWRSAKAGVDNTTNSTGEALVPSPSERCLAPTTGTPFAIDATKPARITWPLDIGPDLDCSMASANARMYLRGRQGANEIQERGAGRAYFPFRLAKAEKLRAWFRVRWTHDGTGSLACNNSWFVGFDDRAAAAIEGNEEGWEEGADRWHWLQGPTVELAPGVHWLRVELREDGVLMDRAALVPVGKRMRDADLDGLAPAAFAGFAGARPPFDPQRLVAPVECWALPTGSLAIGTGHVNEITVGASWQGAGAFKGRISVYCPTAAGVVVEGSREIACGPDATPRSGASLRSTSAPFARNVLTLRFPDDTARRAHAVLVSVADDAGATVFTDEVRFVKGWAWAFLGPLRPKPAGDERGRTLRLSDVEQPCDRTPERLAALEDPAALRLADLAPGRKPLEWRTLSDGSCYDWTGAVDLKRVFGDQHSAFAYAVTFIRAETLLRHRSFEFQADDAGWLWMDGETVAVAPVNLPKEANRLWSSALLSPGANPVVVKTLQTGAYWGFRVDVIDWHWQGRRGDVIRGLEPADWPDRKTVSVPK